MMATSTRTPGDSCQSQPGQQRNGPSLAQWKYTPKKKPVVLSNRDFLAHAFHQCADNEVPWVTGFPGDPCAVHHAMWGGRRGLPLPNFVHADNNNFIAVSSFGLGTDRRQHRRKDCFAAMHIVMVDDVGTKVGFDKLVLEPTCLVETSPGNFQAWYFLAEPERDRLRAETLTKGMISSGLTADGSDPGMNGVTRYGRLPVGINGKAKYVERLGQPFVQKVAIWSPSIRYSIEQIADAYGVDMAGANSISRGRTPRTRGVAHPAAAYGDDGIARILESAGLYLEPLRSQEGGHRIVCPWVHEHTDEDQTGTVYFEPSDGNDGRGGFKCHHGHCQKRTIADLNHFVTRLMQSNSEHPLCKTT